MLCQVTTVVEVTTIHVVEAENELEARKMINEETIVHQREELIEGESIEIEGWVKEYCFPFAGTKLEKV